jgi:hypothetical protein
MNAKQAAELSDKKTKEVAAAAKKARKQASIQAKKQELYERTEAVDFTLKEVNTKIIPEAISKGSRECTISSHSKITTVCAKERLEKEGFIVDNIEETYYPAYQGSGDDYYSYSAYYIWSFKFSW